MSNFTALKNSIQQYIKQNGNEEITGAVLQEILLSMVATLGDSAINGLETDLSEEETARQNADGTLQENIGAEATARQNADTALGNRIDAEGTARENADTALQGAITTINARLNEGYLYKGIATPTTDPSTPTGRLFYIATAAGTYTSFLDANSQPLVVTKGINILKYNGHWELQQVIAIDDEAFSNSYNIVTSGGAAKTIAEVNSVGKKKLYLIDFYGNTIKSYYQINDEGYIVSSSYRANELVYTNRPVNKGSFLHFAAPISGSNHVFKVAISPVPITDENLTSVQLTYLMNKTFETDMSVRLIVPFDGYIVYYRYTSYWGNITAYVYNSSALQDNSVLDISELNAANGTLTEYASLSAAIAAIPGTLQKGGMSIRFILQEGAEPAATDKYVQYILTKNAWSTAIKDWLKVESVNPDIKITDNTYLGKTGSILPTDNPFATSDFCYIVPNTKIYGSRAHNVTSADYTYLCFYDVNKKFLSRLTRQTVFATNVTITEDMIPSDAVYFRACLGIDSSYGIEIPARNIPQTLSKEVGFLKNPVVLEDGNNTINRYGVVDTSTFTSNYVTKPILAEAGVVLHNCHPTSGQEYTFAALYDVHGDCLKVLKHSEGTDAFDYTIQAADIPAGAVYLRATTYANGYASNYKFYANAGKMKEMTDYLSDNSSVNIRIFKQNALDGSGAVYSTSSKYFSVTDFCPAKPNIRIIRPHRLAGSERIICFYDENYNFVSELTESDSTISYVGLNESNIPSNAKYFRAIVWNDPDSEYNGDGYIEYKIPVKDVVHSVGGYWGASHFNYELALLKDRDELVSEIENASCGKCTVLYDNDGYPSLMHRIPKVAIGALAPALGDLTTPHPAFVVNGVEKNYIYVSVFLTSVYNGHYVSWFGLQPKGRLNLTTLRTGISDKGVGWHIETIYEHSLIALLTMNLNSPTPTGNTSNGKSHTKPWEYCQLANGSIPGSTLPSRTGIEWINGTQPSVWSHNKEMWGIQDVIGGYHRICDLVKVMDGKIYLANDNKYFANGFDAETFEEDWVDTGAVYDFIDNQIVLSNQRTVVQTEYAVRDYSTVLCNSGFDTLDIDVRKKLALLLLAPRLSSEDADTVFPITGRFGINNGQSNAYDVTGGAEEYSNSGLGANVISVDLKNDVAHYNMGSRMVYIP